MKNVIFATDQYGNAWGHFDNAEQARETFRTHLLNVAYLGLTGEQVESAVAKMKFAPAMLGELPRVRGLSGLVAMLAARVADKVARFTAAELLFSVAATAYAIGFVVWQLLAMPGWWIIGAILIISFWGF